MKFPPVSLRTVAATAAVAQAGSSFFDLWNHLLGMGTIASLVAMVLGIAKGIKLLP